MTRDQMKLYLCIQGARQANRDWMETSNPEFRRIRDESMRDALTGSVSLLIR